MRKTCETQLQVIVCHYSFLFLWKPRLSVKRISLLTVFCTHTTNWLIFRWQILYRQFFTFKVLKFLTIAKPENLIVCYIFSMVSKNLKHSQIISNGNFIVEKYLKHFDEFWVIYGCINIFNYFWLYLVKLLLN